MATVVGYDAAAKKRVTCKKCSAIVEYVQNEVVSEVHHDYGGGSDTYYHVRCPGCGCKITVRGY